LFSPVKSEAMCGQMTLEVDDQTVSMTTLFTSSRRLAIAEQFRIPYAIEDRAGVPGVGRLRTVGGGELLWADAAEIASPPIAARLEIASGPGIPVFVRVLSDQSAERLLSQCGGSWSPAVTLSGEDGSSVGSIWTTQQGDVFLPFDPDEVCTSYWTESYLETLRGGARRQAGRGAVRWYYRLRGLLPRPLQIWLRRQYARLQARSEFPRWPVETALHDFFDLFTSMLADVAGEPVPRIAAWPDGHAWALVLTHDVETAAGFAAIEPILELERGLGMRSSWNFVPRRYEVDDDRLRELVAEGFEVGVHGLLHDGRDLESLERLRERLPGMREAAERWGAVGFRSPATQRHWELMPMLGFSYDSSYPDSDPFEPQGGGCCTWLPYFNEAMVELPLTMQQDHTLFAILRHSDETAWVQKADFLRDHGGMALIDTHPDYLIEDTIRTAYGRLLERYAGDQTAWKPLPAELRAWWRRRADSRIARDGDDWVINGPAAGQARVETIETTKWR
jgi:hypothetical protein